MEEARDVVCQVLCTFEEMLDQKGIMIPSEDRDGEEDEACLYGRDYCDLEGRIAEILMQAVREWK